MLQYSFCIELSFLYKKGEEKVALKRKRPTREKVSSTRTKVKSLSASDLKHFQQVLLEKRKELLRNVSHIENGVLKTAQETGDLSNMPIHMADLGSDNFEQDLAIGLMDGERKILHEIDEALDRIEKKNYGICLGTGKPISRARLEAQPWAKYSVDYARKLENGLAIELEK